MVSIAARIGEDLRFWRRAPLFNSLNAVFLLSALFLTAYPLIYILSASLSSADAVQRGAVRLLPVEFSLEAYREVFRQRSIGLGYLNSFYYMILGTAVSLSVTLGAAFALSRKELPFRRTLMFLFTFTLLFGGGIIPLYLVVRSTIGVNNRLCMVLPTALSVWNLIIARTFMATTLPEELYEAAKVEGCDTFRYFFHIVLPLSRAIVAVLTLLFALAVWNSYFHAFVFLQKRELMPLQIILREILIQNSAVEMSGDTVAASKVEGMRELLKYALIVAASLPALLLYPFVQKHFVKNIMIGAVKG